MGGAFRYALKSANGAMLNRSTVAPILVRAKRRLVADIPADQLDTEQQFSAEVILP
jgi:ABC-type dipeptide/oligopeptide/nickel transport system ATPase component